LSLIPSRRSSGDGRYFLDLRNNLGGHFASPHAGGNECPSEKQMAGVLRRFWFSPNPETKFTLLGKIFQRLCRDPKGGILYSVSPIRETKGGSRIRKFSQDFFVPAPGSPMPAQPQSKTNYKEINPLQSLRCPVPFMIDFDNSSV